MKITKIIAKRRGIYAGNRRFLDCIDGTIIKKVKETMNNAEIGKAMVIKLDPVLPEYPTFKEGVRRAPKRELTLNKREIKLAVANALRYVPEDTVSCQRREFTENPLMNIRENALREVRY